MDRLSIDFAGTFDLALWCKLLRDRGWTGQQVATWLGRSEGYVNNLIRILDRASLDVLSRWKTELESEGAVAFPGNGKVTGQDEEIRRLRRELSIAQQERDILKKAVGFFAKHKN